LFGTPQKKTLVRSASLQCVCGSSSPTLSAFVFRGSPSISFTPLVRLLLCSLLLLFLTNRALHIPLNPLKRNCLNREVVRIRRATHQGQGQISGHSHLYILYPLIKCLLVFHLGFYIVLLFEFSFQWSFGPFFYSPVMMYHVEQVRVCLLLGIQLQLLVNKHGVSDFI
jgi:hypothetical protein